MGQPVVSDVHVDAALTDMSVAYIQAETNFVVDGAFPVKPVDHKSDKYHIFNKNDWFRDDAVKKRTSGEDPPRSGFTLSQDSYDCDVWSTEVPIDELVRSNADPSVPMDEAAMQLLTQRMFIRRDRLFATAFMATSIWGTDKTGGSDFTVWDNAASDPQKDVMDGKRTVLLNTGLEPNKLTVSYDVDFALKRHPTIKDRIKYTQGLVGGQDITDSMLAAFFGVKTYKVVRSVYATNVEGGTAAMAFTVGKHALLTYDGNPGIMQPCAATLFVWRGLTGFNDLGVRISRYYDPKIRADIVQGDFAFAMKVTGSDLGYFFNAATS